VLAISAAPLNPMTLVAASTQRWASARDSLSLDPHRRSGQGRQAADYLARHGGIRDRLRWSAALARDDRRQRPLFIRAVRSALATSDCDLLEAAVRTARQLPRGDRARVAREFARPRFAHWGGTAIRAGLRVADKAALRRALHRTRRQPTTQANRPSCAM
jgi:hypothetical protein